MSRPNHAIARLAAVAAPALGLAVLWGLSDHTYRQGTEWEVPIAGYDPRDYLRGHYAEFTYHWPGIADASDAASDALCLDGQAPNITRVRWLEEGQPCAHPLRENGVSRLTHGRLYIGQDRAEALQAQLQNRDQRGIITIRQREGGSFTPVSIRFRPLTAHETAERDRQDAQRAEGSRPPPVIMSQ